MSAPPEVPEVLDALETEQQGLEDLLASLDAAQWDAPSACPGWSVGDVVLHLAQTEELVAAAFAGSAGAELLPKENETADEFADRWVRQDRGAGPEATFERWKQARRSALGRLRAADPTEAVPWIAVPLKPRTLATTRLSEHWIHALDVATPLGIEHPDGEQLWHLARLAHRTIPYAAAREGLSDLPDVRLELRSPAGAAWEFGDQTSPCVIRGSAGEFCRVAARRLDPAEAATLQTSGRDADRVLEVVRLYA